MAKSLFEFSKDKKKTETFKGKSESKDKGVNEDEMKKKIDDYSKFSENDLMKELYKEVSKQKSTGEFDVSQLSKQLENVRPMLNQKQNENLEKILKNLK